MRSRLVQKAKKAFIVAGGFALVAYLFFLAIECVSYLWNQNDFLLAYAGM